MSEGQTLIKKRDGREVPLDLKKIRIAIKKAFDSCELEIDESVLDTIAIRSYGYVVTNKLPLTVENIQDGVEKNLMDCGFDVAAKAYILYRKNRENIRNNNLNVTDLVQQYLGALDWRVKENSTVTYSLGGFILANSGAVTANYWLNNIYDDEIAKAHKDCDMHIHDLSMLSPYCAGWSLKQLLLEGLGGVEGKISSAPAKHLGALCNQMVNFLGILQNEWAGAQAFSSFDTYLAPFIRVDNLTYDQVKQCIQNFVFGVNTPSRWGCVDTETEILTLYGWKKYDEVTKDDDVFTWDQGRLTVTPIREIIIKDYTGRMHLYRGENGYQQYVTEDHRVLYAQTDNPKAFDIKPSNVLLDHFNGEYMMPTAFMEASFACAQDYEKPIEDIAMAGLLYAKGKFIKNENGRVVKVIIDCNSDNDISVASTWATKNNYSIDVYNASGTNKSIAMIDSIYAATDIATIVENPDEIANYYHYVSSDEIRAFLTAWEDEGVGLKYKNERMGDDLQKLAIAAGYTSYKFSIGEDKYVRLRRELSTSVKEIIPTVFSGTVWCVNVDTGTVVFRRNGNVFITGNCQAPFSNITMDWTCPDDLKDMPAIVGGESQDFTYGDCVEEMAMINKAFIEVMTEGDADGRGMMYPISTYSITKDFDWSETENNKLLFGMAAKYGSPYFSNYVNSDMEPSQIRSMCCRLRLDLTELARKNGGFFGSGESTGSVGVVTINLPKIAYESKDEAEFYEKLDKVMDIAARSLDVKRKTVTKLMDAGFYPYTKRFLGTFDNHFSTLGIVGMNEAGLNANWIQAGMDDERTQKWAIELLNHMRGRLIEYQQKYGALYNLESTPAESTSYRFAKHDKKRYPDIKSANDNGTPYYTNSTNLPVGYTTDVFEALDIQDPIQILYNSGTVFHTYLGEKLPDWKAAAALVKAVSDNYRLPYYTISPTYSVCPEHGYIVGEHYTCPTCGKETEVWSRITGYYRPIKNWNDGKAQEFKDRQEYEVDITPESERETEEEFLDKIVDQMVESVDADIDDDIMDKIVDVIADKISVEDCMKLITSEITEEDIDVLVQELTNPEDEAPNGDETSESTDQEINILFTTPTCVNCRMIKNWLKGHNLEDAVIMQDISENESAKEVAETLGIMAVPAMLTSRGDLYRDTPSIMHYLQYLDFVGTK